jgi:sulfide:quinone oxidoreductase
VWVTHGEVVSIEPAARQVVVDHQRLEADALVVALGAELAPGAIPGLAEAGHNFYDAAGAAAMHASLRELREGRVVILTATPAYKCPAAPYETAMLVDDWLRRAGRRAHVQVDVMAAEPAPMPAAGPAMGEAVKQLLASKGIGYAPARQLVSANRAGRTLHFADGSVERFDLLGFVPPHEPPASVRTSALADNSGWISVDRATLATNAEGVFAIGDVTRIPLASGRPLPKAGVFAHRQAEVVAANIAFGWTGRGAPAHFDGHGACFVETGGGRAAYGAGDFYHEPMPAITLRWPSRVAHWGKVAYERLWLNGIIVGLPG